MKWIKSEVVENYLNQLGVPYHWEEVPLSDIQVEKSLKNNARLMAKPTDEEHVGRYSVAMKEPGAVFPGLVSYPNGKGKLLADGNHRIAGYIDAGLPRDGKIGCYVLDTDDAMLIAMVTRTLNQINGLPQSKDQAIEQALSLLSMFPSLKPDAVAARLGLCKATIYSAIRARNVADKLRSQGINSDKLPRTLLSELSKLSDSEPAMFQAAEIAIDNDLSLDGIKEMVQMCKSAKSDVARIEALDKHAAKLASRSPQSVERTNRINSSYNRAVHTLYGIVAKHPTLEHLHITSKSAVAEAREDWERLSKLMNKLFA